jgi:hypothetical protein
MYYYISMSKVQSLRSCVAATDRFVLTNFANVNDPLRDRYDFQDNVAKAIILNYRKFSTLCVCGNAQGGPLDCFTVRGV